MRPQRPDPRVARRQRAGTAFSLVRLRVWRAAAPALRIAAPALALFCFASAVMLAQAPTAHGSAPGGQVPMALAPGDLPDVANWRDEQNKTAFSIRLHGESAPARGKVALRPIGQYSFTLPTGDQIVGVATLSTQANGDFIASSGAGQTGISARISTVACQLAHLAGAQPQDVATIMGARFDAHALVAFAQIRFVGIVRNVDGGIANQDEVNSFCAGKSTAPTYTMASGCDASACSDPVANASQEVGQYENQLVAASQNPSQAAWNQVYGLSSTVVRGQYSSAQFATAMTNALKSVGTITAITRSNEPIQVQVAATGQAYFVAHDKVTYSRDGKTSTRDVASYYLLEGGHWHFWFSA
jgi:hypothetical protein